MSQIAASKTEVKENSSKDGCH